MPAPIIPIFELYCAFPEMWASQFALEELTTDLRP
jgi:hypothetical protein